MAQQHADFPAKLEIDYPDRPLNRVSSFFRILWAIPIFLIFMILSYNSFHSGKTVVMIAGGYLFLAPLLLILFRQKYPQWWFNWNLELLRFQNRILAYFYLLTDAYPSTDEHQAVHLDLVYPDAKQLSRGLPLIKWLLVIPHIVVLCILAIGVLIAVVIAWFAILFTGKYPRGLFNYVVGFMRWNVRVFAYAFVLTTDKYPPFSLKA